MTMNKKVPRALKCQVPRCRNTATVRCVESALRYCDDHKHPHGPSTSQQHHHEKIKNHYD